MAPKFYTSIATYYDFIFKPSVAPVNFITAQTGDHCADKTLLEIGCGTGNLCWQLAGKFASVSAIDNDREMLTIACNKQPEFNQQIEFHHIDMRTLYSKLGPASYHTIVCLGNTLVHLASRAEIKSFLEQVKKCLLPGGKFILQIVNYDRIFQQQITALPEIENDKIRFVRKYHFDPSTKKITFHTALTVKAESRTIENEVLLYPLQKNELARLLEDAGFSDLHFYGTFNSDRWHIDSPATIAVASV